MKFLPLKKMILCFILPPLLYAATIYCSNNYLKSDYEKKIRNILLLNSNEIYEGKISLEKAIEKNISQFIETDTLLKKKIVNLEILIIEKSGKIIYPKPNLPANRLNQEFEINISNTAKENFTILEKGIDTKITISLPDWLKTSTGVIYFSIGLILFLIQYVNAVKKTREYEKEKLERIKKLEQEEKKYKEKLIDLEDEKKELAEKINALKQKYSEKKSSEEEMLDEIISLEEKLKAFNETQAKKEEEISEMRERLEELEKKKSIIHRKKDFDFLSKRFETLYKNVIMEKKAYEGFGELEEELQIKAEELIHLLNNEPEKVIIKRKVFSGKRNKTTSFEVIFGYTGRLYFSKNKENKTKILLIGTKNTQNKDMDYLHNL
ncbi:MAG: hypothetical protein H6680_08100 [Desulfobacteraceae bacterium]|nr:hypothetical protein [Desulfobacteraceae bacterium]